MTGIGFGSPDPGVYSDMINHRGFKLTATETPQGWQGNYHQQVPYGAMKGSTERVDYLDSETAIEGAKVATDEALAECDSRNYNDFVKFPKPA